MLDWEWFVDLLGLIERAPRTHWDLAIKGVTYSSIVRYFRSGGEWILVVFRPFGWSGRRTSHRQYIRGSYFYIVVLLGNTALHLERDG